MLLIFLVVSSDNASSHYEAYTNTSSSADFQAFTSFVLFSSFSVKTPLVPVHI